MCNLVRLVYYFENGCDLEDPCCAIAVEARAYRDEFGEDVALEYIAEVVGVPRHHIEAVRSQIRATR